MNLEHLNDGELLREFISKGEQALFGELFCRHAGMVLSVCRRVTGHEQDAEDAMQTVFVMLSKKASALVGRTSIGGWLHHTARYVALNLRKTKVLRTVREQEAAAMEEPMIHAQTHRPKETLARLLDSTLDALPEKYRVAIILHHLEGKTVEPEFFIRN